MAVNPFYDAYETSLSRLDEHEWNIVRNRWARGIDWNIEKLGRHWRIGGEHFAGFPLYRTKKAAGEAHDQIVRAESRWRAYQRWEAEHSYEVTA